MLCEGQSSSLHGPVSKSSVSSIHCSLQPPTGCSSLSSTRGASGSCRSISALVSFMHWLSRAGFPFRLQEVTLRSMSQMSGESLAQSLMRFLRRYHDSLRRIHLKGIFVEGGECIAIPRCLRISGFSILEEINLFHLRDDHKLVNFSGYWKILLSMRNKARSSPISLQKSVGRRGISVFATRVRKWILPNRDWWIGRNFFDLGLYLPLSW